MYDTSSRPSDLDGTGAPAGADQIGLRRLIGGALFLDQILGRIVPVREDPLVKPVQGGALVGLRVFGLRFFLVCIHPCFELFTDCFHA